LEFLAKTIRQQEEIKGIQTGKEETKLSLFAETRSYTYKTQKLHQTLLDIINIFSNVARYNVNLQKPVTFLYTNNE
jgi:hypothetical protein